MRFLKYLSLILMMISSPAFSNGPNSISLRRWTAAVQAYNSAAGSTPPGPDGLGTLSTQGMGDIASALGVTVDFVAANWSHLGPALRTAGAPATIIAVPLVVAYLPMVAINIAIQQQRPGMNYGRYAPLRDSETRIQGSQDRRVSCGEIIPHRPPQLLSRGVLNTVGFPQCAQGIDCCENKLDFLHRFLYPNSLYCTYWPLRDQWCAAPSRERVGAAEPTVPDDVPVISPIENLTH